MRGVLYCQGYTTVNILTRYILKNLYVFLTHEYMCTCRYRHFIAIFLCLSKGSFIHYSAAFIML